MIRSKQTTLNRLIQAAASTTEELKQLEDEISSCKDNLEKHRMEANKSHEYFVEATQKCTAQFKRIAELEAKETLDSDESEELSVLKLRFDLVISVDYQMSKLLPQWGESPQPGSTYYLQKLSHDLFGIVNHATDRSTVYIFDERIGPKNTDHTLSFIFHYITTQGKLPSWIRRVHLFMDNTVSTNKNCYTMSWALEMVQQNVLDLVRVSFMIAGHTKFHPDLLFSKIAQPFNRNDVFTTTDLQELVGRFADVVVDEGELVVDWRTPLSVKYTKYPGIRSQHDFVFTRNVATQEVFCKGRELCYTGAFAKATIHVAANQNVEDNVIPGPNDSYVALNKLRCLNGVKLGHLCQMFDNFIPASNHFPFLDNHH